MLAAGYGTPKDDSYMPPYAWRHTFATFMLARGMDVYAVARWMGTSVAMIERTYGHRDDGAIERARSLMNAAVGRRVDGGAKLVAV